MKVALAQLNYHIGNFEANTAKIISAIAEAKTRGADLVVFAELAVCGYSPLDLLENDEFIRACDEAVAEIAGHCEGIAAIVGAPQKNASAGAKGLYNVAYFLADGAIRSVTRKALLPTYDVFDENRYFESNALLQTLDYQGTRIALTICEDLWNLDDPSLYPSTPMDTLVLEQPDILINIAASPFSYRHDEDRRRVLSANAIKYKRPLFYLNHVGAQTEIIFDGGSLVFDGTGRLKAEMAYFSEDIQIFDTECIASAEAIGGQQLNDIAQIHEALVLGIRDYFNKSGFSTAVLGLSGGIDSAVVCALACEALGSENVLAVLMPSNFSSEHSIKDALDLVAAAGCKHEIVGIAPAAAAFDSMLANAFSGLPFNLTEENIQARCRGIVLMAMANKFGHILLNTSNKSECAVGYGTLYGDMCGALSVIGDVYKTQVFALARYLNREQCIIPENTIVKPPSAELRPDQKDSDSLPDYALLDQVLYQHIEGKMGQEALIAAGFEAELVHRVLALVNRAEFKRHQAPPILRVSPKAFGSGRRMPIVAKYSV